VLVRAIRGRGGLVFPLVVRPWDRGKQERYEVVASQEVYDAAREAGIGRVPVIVKRRLSDEQALELIREIPLYLGSNLDLYLEGAPGANVLQFPEERQTERYSRATE
jgi:ParB-like chromosome segregation protein Spo0J